MSAKAMGSVWEMRLTPAQRIVLLAYADHADHDGRNIRPGARLIAWKTDLSERHVRRITQQLVQAGILIVEAERKGKPTIYRIDLEGAPRKPPLARGGADDMTGDRVTPVTAQAKKRAAASAQDEGSAVTRDRMTHDSVTGDRVTPVTAQAKDDAPTPDMASLKMSQNRQYIEPSDLKAAAATEEPSENSENVEVKAAVFRAYEQNIGLLTPLLADAIADALRTYPADWIGDAIREAALANGKSWKYIDAILKRWERDGRRGQPAPAAAHAPTRPASSYPPAPPAPPELMALLRKFRNEGLGRPQPAGG